MAQSADEMTKYTLDCPDDLWDEWKETVPRKFNLNDGLIKLIAQDTLEKRGDGMDPDTRAKIQDILQDIIEK